MTNLYRAIGKSMASRYAVYAFNVLSLMVLTHTFAPKIFGVVAAAQTIVVLFQMVAEGGISPAIINLRRLAPEDRDGIFGLSLLAALFFALAMWALGPVFVKFYNMADVGRIVPFVSVALFASTATAVPFALLQRQQLFKRIAQAGITAELGALLVAFGAHYRLQELYAYSLYFPTKALLYFFVNWHFSKENEFGQPFPNLRFSAIKPLLGTTSYQLAFNFVNYFSRNLDNILVGKFLGAGLLGIYDRSYQLMRYPLMLLTFAMTPAIQPALREVAHDVEHVNHLHRDLVFKLSIVGSIAALGVFFLAKYIVLIAFGQQWLAVVPIIKLLALTIPAQTILSTSGSFFQAFNRLDLMFYCGLFAAGLNAVAMYWGITRGGLPLLCWALFFSFHLCFLQAYWVLHRYVFGGGFMKFLFKTWPFAAVATLLALLASNTDILRS